MITFLINLSTEKISESTMKIYLYPYLKENKLRIIEGYGLEYNDIVNDIKYYIYNSDNIKSERKEFQLLIVLPIFNEKIKYFGENLTNNIYEVSEKIEERLLEEKVEPNEVSYLILDYLERDFMKKAIDINGGLSEELNVNGYISSPVFTIDDIKNIEKIYKKSIVNKENKEEAWHTLKEELENFFREKKDLVLETEIGKIKDSAIIEHTKKYRIIAKDLENTLKYEFSKKDVQIQNIDIQTSLVEILKRNDYYYNFLFNIFDLEKLQFIWEKNNIVMRGEESYNLSDEFIEKIIQLKEELLEEIKNIVSQKKEALKNVIKYEKGENCYLRERTLEEIQKEFINNYLEKYLGEIIKTKTLKTQRVETPLERIKYLLKKYYSLQKIGSLQRNNIYRIPFIKNNTLKYNENLIKFIYLIMFLIEYGEQKEGYIGNGKSLSLEDVKYRKYYLEELFNKYQNTLRNEEGNIDIRQKKLKSSAEISYYTPQNGTYNKINNENLIGEKEPPEFSKYYEENYIKEYKRNWLEDIGTKLDKYIEDSNEALFDYQNSKNKFMLTPKGRKEINKDIKAEVKECQEVLEKAREDLLEIEKNVKIEIKNEWMLRNKNEISLVELENILDMRPLKSDTIWLVILLIFTFIFSLNPKISLISLQFTISGVIVFALMAIALMVLTINGHYGKIKQIMNTSKRIRDSYINELRECFNVKKEYIDKQILYRVAEKNFLLAKKEEKKIEEKIELLGCYKEIIENHCQITDNILNTLKGMRNNSVDEKEYRNERFSNKLEDLDSKKAPFENDIFNLSCYIEVEEYKKFNLLYNDQENLFVPQNIFGCDSIKIYEDEIYKKVGE